jgi:hypothetical protein
MLAYANPLRIRDERQRGDGYGIVRFDKRSQRITFECWPRFSNAKDGDGEQFPGWPVKVNMADNDGRTPKAWLPQLHFVGATNPVVQVIAEKVGAVLYTVRVQGNVFQPSVYSAGTYTVKVGHDKPDRVAIDGIEAKEKKAAGRRTIEL